MIGTPYTANTVHLCHHGWFHLRIGCSWSRIVLSMDEMRGYGYNVYTRKNTAGIFIETIYNCKCEILQSRIPWGVIYKHWPAQEYKLALNWLRVIPSYSIYPRKLAKSWIHLKHCYTHCAHFQFNNLKLGYRHEPEKMERVITIYTASETVSPGFVEAAGVQDLAPVVSIQRSFDQACWSGIIWYSTCGWYIRNQSN